MNEPRSVQLHIDQLAAQIEGADKGEIQFSEQISTLIKDNTKFVKGFKAEKYHLNPQEFNGQVYQQVNKLKSFLDKNQVVQKKHHYMEESSFQLFDAIRIQSLGSATVLLVAKIWTVDTDFLPHVVVDGLVLQQHIDKSYISTGLSISVPLSDYTLIESVDRAPAITLVHGKNTMYKLPMGLDSQSQIEFTHIKPLIKNHKSNYIGNNNVTEQQGSETMDIQDCLFQTVEPDQDGFAMGERIATPIIISALLIPEDQRSPAVIQSYLLNNDETPAKDLYTISKNSFIPQIPQFGWKAVFGKFLPDHLINKKLFQVSCEVNQEKDVDYIVCDSNKVFLQKNVPQPYNCQLCQQQIWSLSLQADPSLNVINELQIAQQTKMRQIQITNNRVGGCVHCQYCGSAYHAGCITNKLQPYKERFIKMLLTCRYQFNEMNTPCIKCRKQWALNNSIVTIDPNNFLQCYIRDQIRFTKPIYQENSALNAIFQQQKIDKIKLIEFKAHLANWHLTEALSSFTVLRGSASQIEFLKFVGNMRVLMVKDQLILSSFQLDEQEALQPPEYSLINQSNNMDFVLEVFNSAWSIQCKNQVNIYFVGAPAYDIKYTLIQGADLAQTLELMQASQQPNNSQSSQQSQTQQQQLTIVVPAAVKQKRTPRVLKLARTDEVKTELKQVEKQAPQLQYKTLEVDGDLQLNDKIAMTSVYQNIIQQLDQIPEQILSYAPKQDGVFSKPKPNAPQIISGIQQSVTYLKQNQVKPLESQTPINVDLTRTLLNADRFILELSGEPIQDKNELSVFILKALKKLNQVQNVKGGQIIQSNAINQFVQQLNIAQLNEQISQSQKLKNEHQAELNNKQEEVKTIEEQINKLQNKLQSQAFDLEKLLGEKIQTEKTIQMAVKEFEGIQNELEIKVNNEEAGKDLYWIQNMKLMLMKDIINSIE
ncbi:Conserved_hypothetical protein [Hexamita inflata]|uniref:Uncharacterized protein n=1 Tax=Hexamita inflata TaxID=28002 RepID=A0AA86VC28_9EUKA|nr:Conserved hypothetical protein [Hexamita inflata]